MPALAPTLARARRLARRSPRYLAWRLAQEGRREADRAVLEAARRGRGAVAFAKLSADGEALAGTRTAVVSIGAWAAAAAHLRGDPGLSGPVIARAERAARGELEAFGDERLALSRPIPWTSDPHAGHRFTDGFYRRLDYRLIDERCDVKVPWELSRLRGVVELAQGSAVGERDDWRVLALGDIDSWVRANPLGFSVNWTVAMEVALRAVNLICVDGLLLAAGAHDDDRRRLVATLRQHGWFLVRNLEIGDINGNHFLADAVGLVWLGRYLHGHDEADRWLARGREMVAEAAADQVLRDGLDHEGSLRYHVLVLELFLLALAADPGVADEVAPAARRMTDALCAVVGPDGRVPDIGDDDGGRAAGLSDLPSSDARRVLGLAAVLLDHAGAAALAGGDPAAWEDALWLRGPDAVAAAQVASAPPPAPPHHLSDGGIVVMGGGPDRVVVSVGPVGFRGRGGHGHLDAMSFEAVLGDRLTVRDSGTGAYTGDAALREELRDVHAHSVVVVDGLGYAELGGIDQLWSIAGDSPPRVLELSGDRDGQRLVAEQVLPAAGGSATWRRTLDWQAGSLRCRDVVRAPAGAAVRHLLQLPAGRRPPDDVRLPAAATNRLERVTWSERYGSRAEGVRWIVDYVQEAPEEVVEFSLHATSVVE